MTTRQERPDVEAVLRTLKDFQRETVDYVFRRLYLDPDYTRRFLIADEVGLGKTLVARGLIAKAVDHLWDALDRIGRIDIVYICSNAAIARQNINRLTITADASFSFASRITLLPIQLLQLQSRSLNFVSFTPQTSFDLRSSTGIAEERAMLYWLLRDVWDLRGKAPLNVLQGDMTTRNFRDQIRWFKKEHTVDEALATSFAYALKQHDEHASKAGRAGLQDEFHALCSRMPRTRKPGNVPRTLRHRRNALIGRLRALLARTCIQALEPDLIILDEFQRFKHLLDLEGEEGALANSMFEYANDHAEARVLLLSATPYKMYTMAHETDEVHYEDFIRTLRFLEGSERKARSFETLIQAYRSELFRLGSSDVGGHLLRHKRALEKRLRKVMVRSERLAASEDRNGMLTEIPSQDCRLHAEDLLGYLALQDVAEQLGHHDPIEYWKSAPYLLNFMDGYVFKRRFERAAKEAGQADQLAQMLENTEGLLLPWSDVMAYARVDPGNARLRDLLAQTTRRGAWQLVWIPPSLPYYQPEGVYADPALAGYTKRLVFSAWRVVPKVIAVLLSYEAERQMVGSFDASPENTPEARKKRRPLLRFAYSNERYTGMPVLGMIYPCFTLAETCDPLRLAANLAPDGLPTLAQVLQEARRRIECQLQQVPAYHLGDAPYDESWYWAAPILLDLHGDAAATRSWFDKPDLAEAWAGKHDDVEDEELTTRWVDHVAEARKLIHGHLELGSPPPDLAEVLAYLALAGPGMVSLRALSRIAGGPATLREEEIRTSAGQVAWGFLSLFNMPEVMALVRGRNPEEPYWRRVVEYGAEGGLQATLDEYAHVLREMLGLVDKPHAVIAGEAAEAMREVLTLRTAALRVDKIATARSPERARLDIEPQRMRTHFALRFGKDQTDDDQRAQREELVRAAFNAPFWPFVLATTSVGQEGLDFHPYCHAIVHWNLPSNPVDLEQREGRVHRYKGHAVRKNLARRYGLGEVDGTGQDPWDTLFNAALRDRAADASDLTPFWVYAQDDGSKIERHVPALPLSQERHKLEALRRSLTVYRMVFGQSRQEDLLAYLMAHVPEDDLQQYVERLRIDLSPPSFLRSPAKSK